jgi:hypothetical protein
MAARKTGMLRGRNQGATATEPKIENIVNPASAIARLQSIADPFITECSATLFHTIPRSGKELRVIATADIKSGFTLLAANFRWRIA